MLPKERPKLNTSDIEKEGNISKNKNNTTTDKTKGASTSGSEAFPTINSFNPDKEKEGSNVKDPDKSNFAYLLTLN